MRLHVTFHYLGMVLVAEGLILFLTGLWGLATGGTDWTSFFFLASSILAVGGFMVFSTPKVRTLDVRESLLIVVVGWFMISVIGALPYVFAGVTSSLTDALFESISGFTTTGASIFREVESLSREVLLWRSFTHFLGGMGIIIFAVSIIPLAGTGGMTLLRTENPVLFRERSMPLLMNWIRIMLLIYAGLCLLETVLLTVAGLSLFDAVTQAFGTIATGGFSTKNMSIASFHNPAAEAIITVFMFAGGLNFAIYYHLLRKRYRDVFRREDFLFYLLFMVFAVGLVTAINARHVYPSLLASFRYSAFQVVSMSTTTGFATADFDRWPEFCRIFLIVLMLVGACAGSTSGAIKNIRIILLWKGLVRELKRMLHPFGVFSVRVNNNSIQDQELLKAVVFVATYLLIFIIVWLLLCLTGLDIVTALSASAATLGGVGPGLKLVGPMANYAGINTVGKWILMAAMFIGRLELLTFFAVLHPKFWYYFPMSRKE